MKGIQKCFCTRRLCTYTYFYGVRIWKKNYYSELVKAYPKLVTFLHYCDVKKCKPATGRLKKVQDKEIELLKQLTNVFNSRNLAYWLDFGSLLGLYRHNGFIPWDDDIDLCMTRTDLQRILPVIKDMLSNTNWIVREVSKDNHFQVRIHDKKAEYIGIDIFHVDMADNVTDTKALNDKIQAAYKRLARQVKHANGCITDIRNIIRNITETQIIKTSDKISENTTFFYGIDFPHTDHSVLTIGYDELYPLKKADFQGCEVNIPNKMKERLECLYGKGIDDFPRFLFDSRILGE